MTIDVIGAGFGRTGTASLKRALEILGLDPCYHMEENFKHGHDDEWIALDKAAKAGDMELLTHCANALFGDKEGEKSCYKATVDFPGATYYKELMEIYPDAKVILSVRDSPEAWYKSFRDTIGNPNMFFLIKLLSITPSRRNTMEMLNRVFRNQFKDRQDDEEFCKGLYRKREAEALDVVPKERLLVFNVKQGWAPLCEFLGKPIPDVPFPRVNDTAEMKRRMYMAVGGMFASAAALVGMCSAGLYVILAGTLSAGPKMIEL